MFRGDRRCRVLELVRLPSSHGYPSPSRGLAALPTPTLTPAPVSCLHVASGIHPPLCPSTLLVALLEFLRVLFFFFSCSCSSCAISVPQPGMRPAPWALEMWSLNCRTTREVPVLFLLVAPISNDWSPPGSVLGPLFCLHLHF